MVVCAAQMRVYGTAVNLHANDNDGYFPMYAALSNKGKDLSWPEFPDSRCDLTWFNLLAEYVGGEQIDMSGTPAERRAAQDKNVFADFRKCPSGSKKKKVEASQREVWIGCNFGGGFGGGLNGAPTKGVPWVWRRLNDPGFKMFDIRNPAGCISFADTTGGWGLVSPAAVKFNYDWDGDGKNDSNSGLLMAGIPYNYGAPKIHNNKCNIVMCDGHAEKLTFEKFLNSGLPRNQGGDDSIWRFRR